MQRAFNFGAGPAMLPVEAIQRIQDELFDWKGTGVSVTEIGHRTQQFQELLTNLQVKLRKVLGIPDNYKVVFVTGGAQGQFDAIPMNILGDKKQADDFVTGTWSKKAADFAKKHAEVNIVATASKSAIPAASEWKLNPDAAYVYYCPNETVDGIAFPDIPDVGNVPVVADLTSSIAYAPMDYSKFGLAFASAQKNLGIAGVTLVVVREDLINNPKPYTPNVWNYKVQAEQNSSLNTPPTFAIYVMDVMVDWIIAQGGVEALGVINKRKVAKLYNYIDNSSFYVNHVEKAYRSELNVPFNLANNEVLPKFLAEANAKGLKYLAGHISVGGGRASLYNAMPESAVDLLIEFMDDFAKRNG
jgi:phosphoserine aminotransferase